MKHFFKIFFLSTVLSSIVYCMNLDGASVQIAWPHFEGEIGLQQRTNVIVKACQKTDQITNVSVIDENGEELQICTKKNKDHVVPYRKLNIEDQVKNIYKLDFTLCCKGASSGGCKKKTAAKVRLKAKVSTVDNTKYEILTSSFLVWGNRRLKDKQEKRESGIKSIEAYLKECANPATSTSSPVTFIPICLQFLPNQKKLAAKNDDLLEPVHKKQKKVEETYPDESVIQINLVPEKPESPRGLTTSPQGQPGKIKIDFLLN